MRISACFGLRTGLILCACCPGVAHAQAVSLNYDTLSSIEEPISFELADVTFSLTGLADGSVAIIEKDGQDREFEPAFVGNFQVAAGTQLANRWRIGAAYFGQYATRPLATFESADDYTDNVAGFIGTSVGTVLAGNTSGQVREIVRRRRGVGHGALAYDDFYGGLDDWGIAYTGRFGPSVIGVALDDDGDFDLGTVFQRPFGHLDYRASARLVKGEYDLPGSAFPVDTLGVSAVGEVTFGSAIFDIGIGYERFELPDSDIGRTFASMGARKQFGVVRISGEGHYGEFDGRSEIAASLGFSYVLARGLSLNMGGNYRKSSSQIAVAEETTEVIGSIRFSF